MSLTTTYVYDLNGNQTQKTLANGTVENRSYDSRNRVTEVQNVGGAGVLSQYDYTFDNVGNVTQVAETYPYGALTARTIVNQYDYANRLTSEQITTGTDVVTTVYNYDKGHNRTSKVVTGGSSPGTTSYVIGDGTNGAGANQILSVTLPNSTVIGFTYDGNGNRYQKTIGSTSDTYSYDEENRLISLQKNLGANQILSATLPDSTVIGFSYDGNGNRYQKTIGGTSDTYGYDEENRLISLEKNLGDNTGLYSYAYDYRTRRVSRTEPGSADATQAVFNGGTSIEEYSASDGPTAPSAEFVRGVGQGGGVGGLEYNASAVYNQYNSRGDVVGQTDDTGALTYQAGYEAFGTHPDESGSSADRQRANTKEQDPTELLNEGFRYRDLETGTFITRDPLGFAAGPNGYIYCGQNPWSKFDPHGLKELWAITVVFDRASAPLAMSPQTGGEWVNGDWDASWGRQFYGTMRTYSTKGTKGISTYPVKSGGYADSGSKFINRGDRWDDDTAIPSGYYTVATSKNGAVGYRLTPTEFTRREIYGGHYYRSALEVHYSAVTTGCIAFDENGGPNGKNWIAFQRDMEDTKKSGATDLPLHVQYQRDLPRHNNATDEIDSGGNGPSGDTEGPPSPLWGEP